MPERLTDSVQDYLKVIYELTEGGQPAGTNALAERVGVSAPSVTGMLQKLAATKPPLVTYRKHQGAVLTAAGRRAALEVIRHHRLLEAWLVKTLGYSWDEVHAEAERLEHVISEDFEMRVAAALGNPQRDPHGEPIPSAQFVLPADRSVLMASLQAGQSASVRRVNARDPAVLRHLEELGLIPGARFTVLSTSPIEAVMRVQVQGRRGVSVLGPGLSDQVFVEAD